MRLGYLFFSPSPSQMSLRLACKFRAWINPPIGTSEAACPSGLSFVPFFFFYRLHSLLSFFSSLFSSPPLRLAASMRRYLQGSKGCGGKGRRKSGAGRPHIHPYLFWAHLKQISAARGRLFGSSALIKATALEGPATKYLFILKKAHGCESTVQWRRDLFITTSSQCEHKSV